MSLAEANRGDAEQCLALSRQHAQRGEHGAALRYAEKAARLCSDAVSADYLCALRQQSGSDDGASRAFHKGSPEDSSFASPPSSAADGGTPPASAGRGDAPGGTSQRRTVQADDKTREVERVLAVRTGDHYGVLGVARSASPEDIKRAYRRLALLLHPDKNTAPGADDAFKAVSRAFTVLSDATRRAEFDRFGADAPAQAGHAAHAADVSPEELFQMFFGGGSPFVFRAATFGGGYPNGFGGGFPHGFGYPHGPQARRRRRPQDEDLSPLSAQMMPVFFVLLLLFISNIFSAIFG